MNWSFITLFNTELKGLFTNRYGLAVFIADVSFYKPNLMLIFLGMWKLY